MVFEKAVSTRCRSFLPGLVLLSAVVMAPAVPAAHLPVVLLEHLDDRMLALSVEERDLAATPEWQPGRGPVPLKVDEVADLVERWRQQALPEYSTVSLSEIVLKPIESPRFGNRWHYLVTLEARKDDGTRDRYFVAVLFDGKVVPGVLEPAP